MDHGRRQTPRILFEQSRPGKVGTCVRAVASDIGREWARGCSSVNLRTSWASGTRLLRACNGWLAGRLGRCPCPLLLCSGVLQVFYPSSRTQRANSGWASRRTKGTNRGQVERGLIHKRRMVSIDNWQSCVLRSPARATMTSSPSLYSAGENAKLAAPWRIAQICREEEMELQPKE